MPSCAIDAHRGIMSTPPAPSAAAGRHSQRRDRLLIVEDDPVTRAMIAGYFAEHHFDVV